MRTTVFSISPDPTCLYLTPTLRAGIARIRRSISLRQGLSCIFGDTGFGKSSLLRHIGGALSADAKNMVALVAENTDAPKFTFLRSLSAEFDILPQRSAPAQVQAMQRYLITQYDEGKNVIILIDEAQLLRTDVLEAVRSLLNFETHTDKLCQIVLAGQLELRDKLINKKKYKPFLSRIVAPVVLEYLTLEETAAMIQFRHDYWNVPNRFSTDAVTRIHSITGGVPRDIVILCGYALSESDEDGLRPVTAYDIDRAATQRQLQSIREALVALP
jgi:general secretion pathway protein A